MCLKEHVHGRQGRYKGAGTCPLSSGSMPTAAYGFLELGARVALPLGLLPQQGWECWGTILGNQQAWVPARVSAPSVHPVSTVEVKTGRLRKRCALTAALPAEPRDVVMLALIRACAHVFRES